ncbi:MAG: hypothetical protein AAF547_18185 [Actinomycetota bacterium]
MTIFWWEPPVVGGVALPRLYGRSLRFVVVELLRTHGTMTVAQMVDALTATGYPIRGRPSKVISDALRWEVARGRVVRVSRGVYRIGRAPRATAGRIRRFARACHAWIVAITRCEEPPPTPPDRRRPPWLGTDDPRRAPWENTAWLWST